MDRTARPWTILGLAIALFGIPAASLIFRLAGFSRGDSGAIVVRELGVLTMVGLLLWIIVKREQLPLSSIGLSRLPIGRGILWTLGLMVAFAAVLFLCLGAILPVLGLSYGSQGGPSLSLPVTLLVVIRAGIAEEIFYRGYGIERLQALTGNRALAAAIPLILFAAFHFSQGVAGVIIAFLIGAVATAFYLWKRNLTVLIAAHFLLDFIPNILLPLVASG